MQRTVLIADGRTATYRYSYTKNDGTKRAYVTVHRHNAGHGGKAVDEDTLRPWHPPMAA
jgi:hypothetical protein